MEPEPIVQEGVRGDSAHVPGANPAFRERPHAGRKGREETRVGALFRHNARAIVTLAAMAILPLSGGSDCDVQEEQVIEVAVLYWARVRTVAGEPVAGRMVHFGAVRIPGDASTVKTRHAATYTDGRTYFDFRFLLSDGEAIRLRASTTTTDPLYDGHDGDDQQVITFEEARVQEQAQGGRGLASFERTAEFVE